MTRDALIVCLVFGMSLSGSSRADIINVPGDEATIQAGIDAAMAGDEVVVAEGEYFEAINFNGKAITLRSTAPDDPVVVAATILNGNNLFHVVECVSGEGLDTVLSGFVITGGNGNPFGGGMLITSSGATVTNCVFRSNVAEAGGGIMVEEQSVATVTSCSFVENVATSGGGLGGGGILLRGSSATVTDCEFIDNNGGAGGGGIASDSGAAHVVVGCTFSGNVAGFGGGMSVSNDSEATIIDCSYTSNVADPFDGGGVLNYQSNITMTDSTVCGNSPDQINGGFTDGGGNQIADECPCPADLDDDGNVGFQDLLALLAAWGPCVGCLQDLDGDMEVGFQDLLLLLASWGPCSQ